MTKVEKLAKPKIQKNATPEILLYSEELQSVITQQFIADPDKILNRDLTKHIIVPGASKIITRLINELQVQSFFYWETDCEAFVKQLCNLFQISFEQAKRAVISKLRELSTVFSPEMSSGIGQLFYIACMAAIWSTFRQDIYMDWAENNSNDPKVRKDIFTQLATSDSLFANLLVLQTVSHLIDAKIEIIITMNTVTDSHYFPKPAMLSDDHQFS